MQDHGPRDLLCEGHAGVNYRKRQRLFPVFLDFLVFYFVFLSVVFRVILRRAHPFGAGPLLCMESEVFFLILIWRT